MASAAKKRPLMPKATAVWLVENTALTFEQIADFCGLHVLEVKGIADEDVAAGIRGHDPIGAGQLSREEIARGQADPNYRLKLEQPRVKIPEIKTRRKPPRYTPVSRRQDRPNAILWLVRHHPELRDSQIMKLVRTTKPTIQAIRERKHWNSANLQPIDPVTLGLCQQSELDREVRIAAKRVEREREAQGLPPEEVQPEDAGSLLPAEETTALSEADMHAAGDAGGRDAVFGTADDSEAPAQEPTISAEDVFGTPDDKASTDEASAPDAD